GRDRVCPRANQLLHGRRRADPRAGHGANPPRGRQSPLRRIGPPGQPRRRWLGPASRAGPSQERSMILGLRTVLYPAPDLARGKQWYVQVLGKEPYFDQPFYVGFEVGGFELGLIPDGEPGAKGSIAYWGVADAAAALARLLELGAELRDDVMNVGGG